MFNKVKSLLSLPFFSIISFANEPIAPGPIEIKGYVELTDLNENIPFVLEMVEGHPFAYLDVFIYVNDVLSNQTRVLTPLLDKQSYIVSGFKNTNETKNIEIIVRYVDGGIEDSKVSFSLRAPKYNNYTFDDYGKEKNFTEDNPIRTNFTFKGNESKIDYEYESICFNGLANYLLDKSRFIDFSNFSLTIDTLKKSTIEYFEFRVYEYFEHSDLIYLNGLYTLTDVKVEQLSINRYIGINDYKFYVDERNGMIYQNSNQYTNKDLLPFFIPFTFGENFCIDYSIVFYDLGMNHNDYTFQGKIIKSKPNNQFGKELSFGYELIDEPILGVEYVS